ncbi:mesenchyme-specific cell surface glycoprotein [Lingula anatina]|uniref:Mesenchyme-specific cell surface glycoprotein n=1 Tax=Lingula anatina TaxID=7574 RepID=A0A1S3K8J7_LINAN|nr:mesenchyme-specific cell surface glycoprotein [Lingula anatina]|eukprot:XP_013418960.1 mesenchyme-specific cell surface glycoprotein [Lingula anatina]
MAGTRASANHQRPTPLPKMWTSYFLVTISSFLSINCQTQGQTPVTLHPLGTLYLPYGYDAGTPQYDMYKGVAEQCAYDGKHKMVYVVGEVGFVYVVDISIPTNPTLVYNVTVPMVPTDVEVCGSHVAISVKNDVTAESGKVLVFPTFDPAVGTFRVKDEFLVGALPDMLVWTTDCMAILVANEGEGGKDASGQFADPEGSVTIITFNDTQLSGATRHTVDFTAFNERADQYVSRGVRWIFRNQTSVATTLSQDLEPEYITLNKDNTKAYVVLQENNAMAVLDLATMNFTALYPLGFKRWNESGLDASDKDNAISIRPWNILGMYQPDSIKYFEMGGVSYIATANEGDAKEYNMADHGFDFMEETIMSTIAPNLASTIDSQVADAALNDSGLARLRVSRFDGKGLDNKYHNIYAYGGRSFSIFKADDMSLVFDSGDEVESAHARELERMVFNSEAGELQDLPEKSFDARSDNKGPECESLAVAQRGGKTVFFVGNERTSSIIIYSIDGTTGMTPRYESIYRAGGLNATWGELYTARNVGDIDPEALSFIHDSDSPNSKPLLLVSGSVSGTLAIYEVKGLVDPTTSTPGERSTKGPVSLGAHSIYMRPVMTSLLTAVIVTCQIFFR